MGLSTTRWHRPPRAWKQAVAAIFLAGVATCSYGSTTSASFKVTVDFLLHDKDVAACDRSTRASTPPSVTIVCGSTTAPRSHPESRFLLNMYRSGELLGAVDGFMTTGTVTSWRVVRLMDRDFLEIMVGW